MAQISKRELEQNWGVRFGYPNRYEVDILVPAWTGGCKNRIRVGIHNAGEEIYVAEPGLGGNFDLSYRYCLNFPAQGHGFGKILAEIKDAARHGNSWAGSVCPRGKYGETYTSIYASAINVARLVVMRNDKTRREQLRRIEERAQRAAEFKKRNGIA